MDEQLYRNHLDRAASTTEPYERFDALWKAFNVFYEACCEAGADNRERALIRRAIQRIPIAAYDSVLNPLTVGDLVELPPIFDEKAWRRSGVKNTHDHTESKRRLQEVLRGRSADDADLQSLADVLYVIRCNLVHGFKTPNGRRDRDVLQAGATALESLVRALPVAG